MEYKKTAIGIFNYIISFILFMLGIAIILLVAYLTWKYWSFFNNDGWHYGDGYKTRIDGGNLWYLIGMYIISGITTFWIFSYVYERNSLIFIVVIVGTIIICIFTIFYEILHHVLVSNSGDTILN